MAVKFQVNTLDAESWMANYRTSRAITRDSTGKLWIVYTEADTGTGDILVSYSTDDGYTWTEEVVVANAYAQADAGFVIMIDSSDVPHILYVYDPASGSDEIRYTYRNGSWASPGTVRTAASAAVAINYLSGCIDSTNAIHMVYVEGAGDIDYITGTVGSWSAAAAIDNTSSPTYPDIAVSSDDEPYVIFVQDKCYMRYYTSSAWQARETVGELGAGERWPVLALDSSNNVHATWLASLHSNFSVMYNKRTSGTWGTPIILNSPTADNFAAPVLTLDTSDDAHIVYGFDESASDENIYYQKVTDGVASQVVALDAAILQPNGEPSVYAGLWSKYPSSCILAPASSPTVVLLHETGSNADVYYLGYSGVGEISGILKVKGKTLRYKDQYGTERILEGIESGGL